DLRPRPGDAYWRYERDTRSGRRPKVDRKRSVRLERTKILLVRDRLEGTRLVRVQLWSLGFRPLVGGRLRLAWLVLARPSPRRRQIQTSTSCCPSWWKV